jgi:hypothetical protein
MPSNLERMIALADDFFDVRHDPDQLSIDEKILERLGEIHPATRSQENNADGPICWILVIPTTRAIMEDFLHKRISEKELFERTPLHVKYDSLYLCSALVLPEYRRTGLAWRVTLTAIKAIQKDHPISCLFTWSFSEEGKMLAKALSNDLNLPLFEREE